MNKITFSIALSCILMCSACASRDEREDAKCKSYGLQFGTPEYVQCREQLSEQHAQMVSAYFAGGGWRPTSAPVPNMNTTSSNKSTTCMPFAGGIQCH